MARRCRQKGGAGVRLRTGRPNERWSRHAPYCRGLTARLGLLAVTLGLTARTTLGPEFALPDAGWEDQWQSASLGGSIQIGRTDLGLGNAVDVLLGPGIGWNILDFGQIRANVRVQDARFEQALFAYGVLPPMPTPEPIAVGKSASH